MKIEPGPPPPPVRGFRFSGVHGGLKSRGRRDFALIVADRPAVCAAAFTTNRMAAAPVIVARRHAESGEAQAVMVNSGSANAGTGTKGVKFAEWSCRELASRIGCDPEQIIPCSTGVIGVELERTPFARAISLGVDGLSRKGAVAAARAMMTSDAFPKWSHRTIDGSEAVVVGLAKGAGMIHPNMATMLAVVVTDARLSREAARAILAAALPRSFNRISVDGDTSTNDTVVLMASGQAPGPMIDGPSADGYRQAEEAIVEVMDDLARLIVRDGEGATKLVDVVVSGASGDVEADRAARTVANSILVKAAFAGADPNWGRIACALGYAGIDFDPERLEIDIDDVALVRDGVLVSGEAQRMARKAMRADAFTVSIRVGRGPGCATVVTSDLTEAYIHFNSAYTS
ncbi:MAG: bifunctional glutamate N-acetyltransferase/amino-acid acetyltransferase ArgJ [Deltaproteobacteria bacterium]|nr:MAG: bifunctional glutamate N-acetyltransferase/amino-acid acetyltransferase ArgJ [Deltaproteobacteria bacterium]